jgi:hypothetical protein
MIAFALRARIAFWLDYRPRRALDEQLDGGKWGVCESCARAQRQCKFRGIDNVDSGRRSRSRPLYSDGRCDKARQVASAWRR